MILNTLNAGAGVLIVFAAVRALQLFHCRAGLLGRAALAACAFYAWVGIASGELQQLRGIMQGAALSCGAAAGVFVWRSRKLRACESSEYPRVFVDSNSGQRVTIRAGRPTRV